MGGGQPPPPTMLAILMKSIIFDNVLTGLESGSTNFAQTNIDDAIEYFENLKDGDMNTFRVGIIGDITVTNATRVTGVIGALLRSLGSREELEIVTGERRGVERIVRNYCKLNALPVHVECHKATDDWDTCEWGFLEDRDEIIVNQIHALIIITDGECTSTDKSYKAAINMGLLVHRRTLPMGK